MGFLVCPCPIDWEFPKGKGQTCFSLYLVHGRYSIKVDYVEGLMIGWMNMDGWVDGGIDR